LDHEQPDHSRADHGDGLAGRFLTPPAERLAMFREALGDPPAVSWSTFTGLVVDEARRRGASVLVRGVRGPSDLELEGRNALGNRDLSGVETLFLISDPRWAHVSSSLVREIATLGGDVSKYVPPNVQARLASR
jgi:pantetheine-phosphate adenylyltransferase